MVIAGLGTAAPTHCYAQQECWDTLQHAPEFHALNSRSRALLKKILTGRNGIESRHLALASLAQAFDLQPDALHRRFLENAPLLATQAAERALHDANTTPPQIDAVIISTCTGYLCPGLTSYVAERLGLRPDVLALDLVGQGCAAATPNFRAAEALLAAGRAQRVLSICVEICSAAFYFDDDPGVLISACLFGDGAGAAVLANSAPGRRRMEWKLAGSILDPRQRDLLRFEQRGGMLRNLLSIQVPPLAADCARRVLDETLARAQLRLEDIRSWIFHPGGRDILSALQARFGLSEAHLRWSAAVLRQYGNLSSASVFFVLQAALTDSLPSGYCWMSSFGAGFSGHGALWELE